MRAFIKVIVIPKYITRCYVSFWARFFLLEKIKLIKTFTWNEFDSGTQ